MTREIGGGFASDTSPSPAAIMPRRAAPKAAPKSPAAGTSIGIPRVVAMAESQYSDRDPPPTAINRSIRVPVDVIASRLSPKGECHAFQNCAGSGGPVGNVFEPCENTPDFRVVMGRPLAAKIRRKNRRPGACTGQARRSALLAWHRQDDRTGQSVGCGQDYPRCASGSAMHGKMCATPFQDRGHSRHLPQQDPDVPETRTPPRHAQHPHQRRKPRYLPPRQPQSLWGKAKPGANAGTKKTPEEALP